ncbi:MAG: beta strand repeat-containing protein [Gaiellaceae bacterium]
MNTHWRRLSTLAFVAAISSVFVLTALAGSGTVIGGTFVYTAAAGEVNHVTLSGSGGNLIVDDSAGVSASSGCATASSTELNCGPLSALSTIVVNLGDGSDSVVVQSSVTGPSFLNLLGGAGNDTMTNNSSIPATFNAGAGNDTMVGKAGGSDTADYSSSPFAVNVDLAAGTATGNGNDTLTNITNVTGSDFADTLSGDDRANALDGGSGGDTIAGRAGNDTLTGGGGSNTVDYSDAAGGVNVSLGAGTETPAAGSDAGFDTLSGFQTVIGSSYADSLTGDGNDNVLSGGAGNDTFDGAGGSDTVSYASAPAGVNASLGSGTANDGQGGTDTFVPTSVETLTGSAFDDTLTGDASDNVLSGGGGNDTLAGGGGTDTLDGGTGSNTADYSAAAGSVTASIAAGQASTDGDGGTDTYLNIQNLTGSAQADTLTGDDGPNTINGGGGPDRIDGGAGNDVLDGQSGGDDSITGGMGNDTINGGTGSGDAVLYASSISSSAGDGVHVDLGAGTASAIGTNDAGSDTVAGIEDVMGSPFADSLTGDAGANLLNGGDGNDSFAFSGGGDTFAGGTGTNSADFSADTSGIALDLTVLGTPQAGADNTTIAGNGGQSSIQNVTGSPQSDTITGDAQQNTLSGGGGSDTIDGGGDNDTVNGDAGNDVLSGGSGDDSVNGGDGNDTLSGRAGSDALDGGTGTNTANYGAAAAAVDVNLRAGTASNDGDGGSDTLTGIQNVTAPAISGNVLQGDAGNNVLDSGGAGSDTVSYSGAANGVTVDLGAGTATGDGTDTLIGGYATVTGSSFGDSLTAAPGGSVLNGGGGNDTLAGGPGNDAISGGNGDDSVSGSAGVNTLDGGPGKDTLDYSSATSVPLASLAAGAVVATWPSAGTDSLANFENVTGSPGADVLIGDGGDNVLRGLGGNDFLQGGAGDDSLQGGSGNDTADFADSSGGVSVDLAAQTALGDGTDNLSLIENANGSNFADQLSGNGGPNTLQGLGGNDQLDGGGGSDTIGGGNGDDSIYAKDGIADNVTCGSGNDTATVDAVDSVNADCEIAGFLGGPVVQTLEASGVTIAAATLNGSINPDGRAVTYQFRYGLTSGYGLVTPVQGPLAAGHSAVHVSAALSGLLPSTTYHYQLVVTDAFGNTTSGSDQSFTTGTQLTGPLAVTLLAGPGDPPGNTAVLYGRVTTNGTPTTWYFEYGPTTAYGQQTPAMWLGATSTGVQVFTPVSLKPPQKTWHFRLVATNGAGTSIGADQPFSTPLQMSLHTVRHARRSARHSLRAHGPRRHH